MIYIFPDTNVFLHFPPLGNIDWLSAANAKQAEIVISPVALRELNTHKDAPRTPKMRQRADAALKRLAEFRKNPAVRADVSVSFRTKDPTLNFEERSLSKDINDDWLIATALEFGLEDSARTVLVATGDIGLDLKISSQQGIGSLFMPEIWRLPEEEDAQAKKLKELEKENAALKSASPRLVLAFADGKDFHEFRLVELPDLTDVDMDQSILQVKNKYPLRRLEPGVKLVSHGVFGMDFTRENTSRYNNQLEQFYKGYKQYLREERSYLQVLARTVITKLVLTNIGSVPANEIDLHMHFPDGFSVDESFLEKPSRPEPPATPEDFSRARFAVPNFGAADFRMPTFEMKNSHVLSVKKSKSYDVKMHVSKLKHTFSEDLPTLYLTFPTLESARSFSMTYQIVADNAPSPFIGSLNFVVSGAPVK